MLRNISLKLLLPDRKVMILLFVVASLQMIFPAAGLTQVRPINDRGSLGIEQLLRKMNTTASVMMIGAHPDDEDSALLAYLARGENARTAYLSLTRGDGGQNIIGPELFESLGVIRTEELLQARRLDGAQQYFTRAFDFGFSKTLAEAKQKWDEKIVLCDAVRAIRSFQPLVVISRFTGTPRDGHGHHQFAGYLSPIAVRDAADPQQCTQAGPVWRVPKFYVEQGFGANLPAPAVRLNTGAYDPILGRSYFEVAMEGRSQHKSQGEGRIEFHGDQYSGLNLPDASDTKTTSENSPFDGLDTSIAGLAARSKAGGEVRAKLLEVQTSVTEALRSYRPSDPRASLPLLVRGVNALNSLQDRSEIARDPVLAAKGAEFSEVIRRICGVTIDALSNKETVVPGNALTAAVKVYYPKQENIRVKTITLSKPSGWQVLGIEMPAENTPGFNRREASQSAAYFNVTVPAGEKPTNPYWLNSDREGDLYHWPEIGSQTFPFEPQAVVAKVTFEIGGTEVEIDQPLQYRFADAARGEIRRNVDIVPQLSVSIDQKLLILPENDRPQHRQVVLSVTNNSPKPVRGAAGLNFNTPTTLTYSASANTFDLMKQGDRASISFDVTIPANTKPGTYQIYGQAVVGESLATNEMHTISYPHIQTHRFYTRAQTDVHILGLKVEPVTVGYIMGSGDEVPDAIRRMGVNLTMLDDKDIASGDLSGYDTIVVGIRATETRPALIANNQRLLDYVKSGGNILMQYQRGEFAKSGLPPYPVDTVDKQGTAAGSIARVVDENAPVRILQPQHAVFNFPNKITQADFTGWVQERNAYNLVTFDPQYTPLLESHDAGEQENMGGLVVARVGKGTWIYCSYSFFRQLPAGVPGAYRLFADLLSLPKAPTR